MISRRAAFFTMLAIALILAGRVLSISVAAIGAGQDICILQIGPDVMHFAGYQSDSSDKTFCENIPATGETIFVFDYEQPELREMATDFRIV